MTVLSAQKLAEYNVMSVSSEKFCLSSSSVSFSLNGKHESFYVHVSYTLLKDTSRCEESSGGHLKCLHKHLVVSETLIQRFGYCYTNYLF